MLQEVKISKMLKERKKSLKGRKKRRREVAPQDHRTNIYCTNMYNNFNSYRY